MSPREVFGIIVRTSGLLSIVYGFWGLSGMIFPERGSQPTDYLFGSGPPRRYRRNCVLWSGFCRFVGIRHALHA
jgi:hypothetical protein